MLNDQPRFLQESLMFLQIVENGQSALYFRW